MTKDAEPPPTNLQSSDRRATSIGSGNNCDN